MNNKGFTLVELLAVITILSILMLIAVPNIVGAVKRSRDKTFVEDAKKMISMAQYYQAKNTTKTGKFSLSQLDDSREIVNGPNNGLYDRDNSYVNITNSNGYVYTVCLQEEKSGKWYYINNKTEDKIYDSLSVVESGLSQVCQ